VLVHGTGPFCCAKGAPGLAAEGSGGPRLCKGGLVETPLAEPPFSGGPNRVESGHSHSYTIPATVAEMVDAP